MLILWILIGTWHGAGINYIFSVGLLQFLYIFLGEIFDPIFVRIKKLLHINDKKLYWHIFQSLRTTALMMFAWAFFNSKSFMQALRMIRNIFVVPRLGQFFAPFYSEAVNGNYLRNIIFIAVCIVAIIVVDLLHDNQKSIRTIVCSKPYPIRLAFYLILAFTIIIFGAYGNQYIASNFIYFEF